jgi:type II secretory pathway component PulJ
MGALVRRVARREDGFTVMELVVATFIMGVVSLVFTTTLSSVQRSVSAAGNRSLNNNNARLAVDQLDREIRSGNILYDPLTDDPAGFHLRIYTQTNGEPFSCVQWRIASGQMQRRERQPGNGGPWPAQWHVVAENVVNATSNPQVKAFQLDPDSNKGKRTLDVTIVVNSTPSNPATRVRVVDSITGRNTSYGYPSTVCDPLPPD